MLFEGFFDAFIEGCFDVRDIWTYEMFRRKACFDCLTAFVYR